LDLAIIDFNISNLRIKDNKNIGDSLRNNIIEVCKRVKEVFKKYEASSNYLSCVLSLGSELTKIGKLEEGKGYLEEAERLALETRDYKSLIYVYEMLAVNARTRGDIASEAKYLQIHIIYNDSLFQENKSKAITELQTKYETEKKEQENLLLSKENEKKQLGIYFSIGGLILLSGLVFMIYRNSKQKTKANHLLSA